MHVTCVTCIWLYLIFDWWWCWGELNQLFPKILFCHPLEKKCCLVPSSSHEGMSELLPVPTKKHFPSKLFTWFYLNNWAPNGHNYPIFHKMKANVCVCVEFCVQAPWNWLQSRPTNKCQLYNHFNHYNQAECLVALKVFIHPSIHSFIHSSNIIISPLSL